MKLSMTNRVLVVTALTLAAVNAIWWRSQVRESNRPRNVASNASGLRFVVSILLEPGRSSGRTRDGKLAVGGVETPPVGAIVEVGADRSPPRVLVNRFADDLRLSPDGRYLAFNTERNEVGLTRVGESPQVVPELEGLPVWSPDGKSFLCWRKSGGGGVQTVQVGVPGLEVKVLPAIPATDQVQDWSSDGRWLLATSAGARPSWFGARIVKMAPNGSHRIELTREGTSIFPRFSPDGRTILYMSTEGRISSLMKMDASGKHQQKLVDGLGLRARGSWSPGGDQIVLNQRGILVEILDRDGRGRSALDLEVGAARYVGAVECLPKFSGGPIY